MSEILSSLNSPDSAYGTKADNTPEEAMNSSNEEYLNANLNLQDKNEKVLNMLPNADDEVIYSDHSKTEIQCELQETVYLEKCYDSYSTFLATEIIEEALTHSSVHSEMSVKADEERSDDASSPLERSASHLISNAKSLSDKLYIFDYSSEEEQGSEIENAPVNNINSNKMENLPNAPCQHDIEHEKPRHSCTAALQIQQQDISEEISYSEDIRVHKQQLYGQATGNVTSSETRKEPDFSAGISPLKVGANHDIRCEKFRDSPLSTINIETLTSSSNQTEKASFIPPSSNSPLQLKSVSEEDLTDRSDADECISLIDSEVDSVEGSEDELVVSASIQFSLSKPAIVSDEVLLSSDVQDPGISPSITVPVNDQPKANEDQSECDEVSDVEEDEEEEEEDLPAANDSATLSELETLPDTVTKLTNAKGSKVYLVGTAHFSKESQDDVAKTIRVVQPDIVVLELCKSRTAVLELDEETILNESKSLDLSKVRVILKQHGKVQGILYILLLSVSAHITKELKMAPGGEFRVAIHEARRTVPGCLVQLGDRPIQVTLSRALASLSLCQKAKLMWHILASKGPISKEEVEKCKKKDFIEEMLAEMTGQFPGISEVFVKERDIYLTRSLQMAADPNFYRRSPLDRTPRVVVGVVGIGHVSGIVALWDKVTEEDIVAILEIPPPSLSDKILKSALKCTFYGLVGFGIYKCLPSTVKLSLQASVETSLTKLSNFISQYISYNK